MSLSPLQPGWTSLPAREREDIENTYRWATVTDNDPLTIRLDGDTAALPMVPETLIDPAGLVASDRVWTQLFGRRVIVLGKAY